MEIFKDKVAAVTGAARGIGAAIAEALAKKGATLTILDMNAELLNRTAEKLRNFGVKVFPITADISVLNNAKKFVDHTVDKFGRLDYLVNNAGITRDNLLMRMSEDEWNAVITVNLKGTFNCIKAVTRQMMKQRSGRIINIASVIGQIGNAGQSNYAASKAGVIGLTKSVAKELASRNVTCNAIAPGFIETEMTAVLDENVVDKLKTQIPLGRLGSVSDVANTVCFLASDDASYITGQVINVDGGMVMN